MAVVKNLTTKPLPMSVANTSLEHKCLNQGVCITYSRRIILGILEQATEHLTVEAIYRIALLKDTAVTLSTVYSSLRKLAKAGVIERRRFQSKQSYYSASDSDSDSGPRDQLVDIDSGRVIEFRNQALDQLKAEIAQEYGFSIADCRVEFYARPL